MSRFLAWGALLVGALLMSSAGYEQHGYHRMTAEEMAAVSGGQCYQALLPVNCPDHPLVNECDDVECVRVQQDPDIWKCFLVEGKWPHVESYVPGCSVEDNGYFTCWHVDNVYCNRSVACNFDKECDYNRTKQGYYCSSQGASFGVGPTHNEYGVSNPGCTQS